MTLATAVTWIVFGLIVGAVANLLDPNPNRMGVIGSVVLGVLGAVLGGLVANLVGFSGITGLNLYSFIIALIGALVVLWVGRSLYPSQSYGPDYYDEDPDYIEDRHTYTDRPSSHHNVEVETTTRKVSRHEHDDKI